MDPERMNLDTDTSLAKKSRPAEFPLEIPTDVVKNPVTQPEANNNQDFLEEIPITKEEPKEDGIFMFDDAHSC